MVSSQAVSTKKHDHMVAGSTCPSSSKEEDGQEHLLFFLFYREKKEPSSLTLWVREDGTAAFFFNLKKSYSRKLQHPADIRS